MRLHDLYVGAFPRFITNSPPHTHTHTHTRTRPSTHARAHTLAAWQSRQSMGGVVPCSLRAHDVEKRLEMRTIPGNLEYTHCISRSDPRPPTRSAYAPASPLSPCLPAPRHTYTQSRPSDHPLQHQVTTPTPTRTHSACSRQMGTESAHDGAPCQPRRQPRIHPASRSHTRPCTCTCPDLLPSHPRLRAVPASIACGRRGILWNSLLVGGATVGTWHTEDIQSCRS